MRNVLRKAASLTGAHLTHGVLHAGYFAMIVVEHHGLMAWLGGALLITTVSGLLTGGDDA